MASDPHSPHIEILLVGMNGDLRGKRIPAGAADKIWAGEVRLPTSTQSLDIWGDDNDDLTGLSLTLGDPDGHCRADPRSQVPMPWGPQGSSQVLATMHELSGEPSFMDPRAILGRVIDRYTARGLTPVVATELEFYVIEDDWRETGQPRPPQSLAYRGEPNGFQLYDMRAVDALDDYLATVRQWLDAQNLPADATTAEFGPGQFEINLKHRADAMAAADDCLYLKRTIEQAARKHGLKSTCMAKPYSDHAGSGLHVHASIIDDKGQNILDAGGDMTRLKSVTAGLLATMRDAQLVFAPFANSYRRFQPGSFAPVDIDWGIGHRGTAVRIPETTGPGARIEHRVAGADANPYLLLAAILGGMLAGLDETLDPGPMSEPGNPVPPGTRKLTHDFLTAVEDFSASPFIRDVFGARYQALYGDTKRKEAITHLRTVSDFDYRTYLPRV